MLQKTNGNSEKNSRRLFNGLANEYIKDTIFFETTYEKVLKIINQVKDFIKKTSKTSQKLIDDLEWVIKVITNKSLYSYKVNKEKIERRNSQFEKFINFVTKYNEEVLEINKRHILVSSLITISKKEEVLLKPSLCLTKILADELKTMDYEKEKERKEKRRNSITQIGNIFLNIYYKGLEQQKKEKEEKELKDKSEKAVKHIKFEKIDKSDKKENKTDKKNYNPNINIERHYRNDNYQNFIDKFIKEKTTYNNQRTKRRQNSTMTHRNKMTINEAEKIINKKKSKLEATIYCYNKKETNNSQMSLNKPVSSTNVKKTMDDNYTQVNLFESKFKGRNINQGINNESILDKKRSTSLYFRNKTKIKSNEIINDNDNQNFINKTKTMKIEKKGEEKPLLRGLIDKYFDDMRTVLDKDFNIFEFKKKVGYKNVLPLMGHVILKTLGLLDSRIITLHKLSSFLYSVSDNYKETSFYHNSIHGADVTQSLCIFFLNSNAEEICETTVLDLLGMIISALGHDLGHPGYNNNFHINACTELALTYNDLSCLENYHSSLLFRILKKDENNIFERLNSQNYKSIRKRMISQILATDMANHGEIISLIRAKIKAWEEEREEEDQKRFIFLSGNEKTKFDEQQSLLNYLIHEADLGHNTHKFEICIQWVELLLNEFWNQGDIERSKGIQISFLCDRNKIDVPASQVGFLKGFIITSFDCLVYMFPNLNYTMENAANNIKEWQKLMDEHRVRGWTPKKEKEKEINSENRKNSKNKE